AGSLARRRHASRRPTRTVRHERRENPGVACDQRRLAVRWEAPTKRKNAKTAKSAKANCSLRSSRPSRSLALLVAAIAAAAIGSAACSRARPAPTVIRVGYSGEADFSDLPSFVAQARLRGQGFPLEANFFHGPVA